MQRLDPAVHDLGEAGEVLDRPRPRARRLRARGAVPPVETSSTPSSARPRAKSTTPRLSETESSARRTRTAPGCVAWAAVDEVAGGSAMAPSIVARPAEPPTLAGPAAVGRLAEAPRGQLAPMEHPRSGAEEQLEKTGDELEERLERLDEHLDEAHDEARRAPPGRRPTRGGRRRGLGGRVPGAQRAASRRPRPTRRPAREDPPARPASTRRLSP